MYVANGCYFNEVNSPPFTTCILLPVSSSFIKVIKLDLADHYLYQSFPSKVKTGIFLGSHYHAIVFKPPTLNIQF